MDISAIEPYIRRIKDTSIKEQIRKKMEKVMENPLCRETKGFKLKGICAVKVNNQRIVILYRFDKEDPCKIVLIDIGTHEEVYKNTY